MVEPIDEARQQLVRDATGHFIDRAQQLFGRRFAALPVLFDLSGRSAGMFKVMGRRRWIRYNPWIFAKYFEENLRDTVPHEVAHYIVHIRYGARGVKPHGQEWQALMGQFGVDPCVTFDLDLGGVPLRRQQTHSYRCTCSTHQVSTTRHNRVLRGQGGYLCRRCDGPLVYVP